MVRLVNGRPEKLRCWRQPINAPEAAIVAKRKPKINYAKLLRNYRAGKAIGSTNRARLVARGLIARKSGPYKGQKKDLGNRGKS